jgi:hypothetical protein
VAQSSRNATPSLWAKVPEMPPPDCGPKFLLNATPWCGPKFQKCHPLVWAKVPEMPPPGCGRNVLVRSDLRSTRRKVCAGRGSGRPML